MLLDFGLGFQDSKIWLMETTGLARDALHVYVGLAIFFGIAALFRLPLRDIRPLVAVILVAAIGEAWDIYTTGQIGSPQVYAGNWHDLWNSAFWPLVIFALARWTPVFER